MPDELPWEDGLLERKVENDLKDLLKTLVAFSNSVRPGHTATILIGEKDGGTIQGVINPDNIQKTVREECDNREQRVQVPSHLTPLSSSRHVFSMIAPPQRGLDRLLGTQVKRRAAIALRGYGRRRCESNPLGDGNHGWGSPK